MPYYAQVTAVHPDSHSVDVEMMDGRVLTGVPVLSQSASKSSGLSDLPDPGNNAAFAVLDFCNREIPFILGFHYPQIGQCQFTENRFLHRHHSDFYTTVDESANFAMRHPSGASMLIGEAGVAGDLSGADVDGKFAVVKNTGKAVSITFRVGGVALTIGAGGVSVTGGGLTVDNDVKAGTVSLQTHVHGNGNNGADTTAPK